MTTLYIYTGEMTSYLHSLHYVIWNSHWNWFS